MKRHANSIFTANSSKMSASERAHLLDLILNSAIEVDCLTEALYCPAKEQDFFLGLMAKDAAECKRNFPNRLVECSADEKGMLATNGKSYRKATPEDVKGKKDILISVEYETLENMKKKLNKMTVAEIKKFVQADKAMDKAVKTSQKKELIIKDILIFFKLTEPEEVSVVEVLKTK